MLVVDQAEEVLTLNPGIDGFENRSNFFHFLREFQVLEVDARFIVSLRTEFYGRFIDATQVSHRAGAEFRQFFLRELAADALVEAIVRPTSKDDIGGLGSPYSFYRFEFEHDLPQHIVQEITDARYGGPPLPVLQLVCLGLYEDAKREGQSIIRKAEYVAKGGVEGQIIGHISHTIRGAYPDDALFAADLKVVRAFLRSFYAVQDDGSVVARTRAVEWASSELSRRKLSIAPEKLFSSLTSPQTMLLRPLRTVKPNGQTIDEVTLGHDSVALALERWETEELLRESEGEKYRLTSRVATYRRGLLLISAAWPVATAVFYFLLPILDPARIVYNTITRYFPTTLQFQPPLDAVFASAIAAYFVAYAALAYYIFFVRRTGSRRH